MARTLSKNQEWPVEDMESDDMDLDSSAEEEQLSDDASSAAGLADSPEELEELLELYTARVLTQLKSSIAKASSLLQLQLQASDLLAPSPSLQIILEHLKSLSPLESPEAPPATKELETKSSSAMFGLEASSKPQLKPKLSQSSMSPFSLCASKMPKAQLPPLPPKSPMFQISSSSSATPPPLQDSTAKTEVEEPLSTTGTTSTPVGKMTSRSLKRKRSP